MNKASTLTYTLIGIELASMIVPFLPFMTILLACVFFEKIGWRGVMIVNISTIMVGYFTVTLPLGMYVISNSVFMGVIYFVASFASTIPVAFGVAVLEYVASKVLKVIYPRIFKIAVL